MKEGKLVCTVLLLCLTAGCVPAQVANLPRLDSQSREDREMFLQVPGNYILGKGDKIMLSLSNEVVPVDTSSDAVYRLEPTRHRETDIRFGTRRYGADN